MSLLADGISYQDKITVIILCIAVLFFVLVDVVLVIALHRHNKKLAKTRKVKEHPREEEKPNLTNQ